MTTENTANQPPAREIRVFLSSTFRDMDAERNYLLQHVFPAMRLACAERDVGFTEIDLRWGITEVESRNGRTVDICLAEIDRCRAHPPYFIGFIGERYGWVPREQDLQAYWQAQDDTAYTALIRDAVLQRISVTELEMRFAAFDCAPMLPNTLFMIRSAALSAALYAAERGAKPEMKPQDYYDDGGGKLEQLKQLMRASGRLALDGYDSVAAFGDAVHTALREALDARYPASSGLTPRQRRALSHERFAASRLAMYVPSQAMRGHVLGAVRQALHDGGGARLLYLSGPSGSGKSALLADLASHLPLQLAHASVFARYAAADGGIAPAVLAEDLSDAMAPAAAAADDASADPWPALLSTLALRTDGGARPLLLLFDGADQMPEPAALLAFLAGLAWPAGVVLIVSGTPQLAPQHGYRVIDMAPSDESARLLMISRFNREYGKTLGQPIVERLAASPKAASPLMLRMVLEDLRVHSHHETLGDDLDRLLGAADAAQLFGQLRQRWDQEYGDAGLASRLLALLALSRKGLSESELADLLAAPGDPLSPETGRPRLPAARLNPLLAVIRPYLLRQNEREQLMHATLIPVVMPADPAPLRAALLDYFSGEQPHALAERLHQLLGACLDKPQPAASPQRDALSTALWDLRHVTLMAMEDPALLQRALSTLGASHFDAATPAAALGRDWATQLDGASALLRRWAEGSALDAEMVARDIDNLDSINLWANTLQGWGYPRVALPLYRVLLSLREALPDTAPLDLAVSLNNLAGLHLQLREFDAALPLFELALTMRRAMLPAGDKRRNTSLLNLAVLLVEQEHFDAAEALLREALGLSADADCRAFVPGDPDAAHILQQLASLYAKRGDLPAAEAMCRQMLGYELQRPVADQHGRISAWSNLSQMLVQQGRFDEAAQASSQALALARSTAQWDMRLMAVLLANQGLIDASAQPPRYSDASINFEQAAALNLQTRGADAPELGAALFSLGNVHQACQQYAPARIRLTEALRIFRLAYPAGHPTILNCLDSLSRCYSALQQHDRAQQAFEEPLAGLRAQWPSTDARLIPALEHMAGLCRASADTQQADACVAEAAVLARLRDAVANGLHKLEQEHTLDRLDEFDSLDDLADLHAAHGKLMAATAEREHLVRIVRDTWPDGSQWLVRALYSLAQLYREQQRAVDAVPLLEQSVALTRVLMAPGSINAARCAQALIDCYFDAGMVASAEAPLRQLLDDLARYPVADGDEFDLFELRRRLGIAQRQAGQFDAALATFSALHQASVPEFGADDERTLLCQVGMGLVHRDAGRTAQARALLGHAATRLRLAGEPDFDLIADIEQQQAALPAD